jgi:sugar lactone lactonase YvrE
MADEKGGGLRRPEGVACTDGGAVVGDTGNGRLVRYSLEGGSVRPTGEIRAPQLSAPLRVQLNSKGEIFALDGARRRITRFAPDGTFRGYLDPDGLPAPAAFVPRSFKIDRQDNLYLLDILSARVLVLGPDGRFQRQLPLPEERGFVSDLAVDAKGGLFLLDSVRATILGSGKEGAGFFPLTKGLREHLQFPTSLTTDGRGVLYLVDENGSGIVRVGPDGSFLGRQLEMGWNEGLLYYPSQICLNDRGQLLVADRGNHRVQIFSIVR